MKTNNNVPLAFAISFGLSITLFIISAVFISNPVLVFLVLLFIIKMSNALAKAVTNVDIFNRLIQ